MFGCMNTSHMLKRLTFVGAIAIAATFAPTTIHAEELPVPPSAPRDVAVTVKGTSVSVRWAAPSSAGAWPIVGYTASTTPGDFSCVTAALSCTITGLAPGQTYKVTVRADSWAGVGELSDAIDIAAPYAFESRRGTTVRSSAPDPSFATHAVIRVISGKVNIGLRTPKASAQDAQIIRYTVQLFDSSGSPVAKGANGALRGRPTTVTVASGAGTYTVWVTAQKRDGSKVSWKGPKLTIG